MRIHIGTDHAGFELKNKLVEWLMTEGHEVVDHGAHELNKDDDYPDFVQPVAKAVASFASQAEQGRSLADPSNEVRGIILGGSGQGEAMVANRVRGVRAGVYYGGDISIVKLLREHNNANILSLGARFISEEEAILAVKTFLETPFSGEERHVRRIGKIDL